MKIRVMLEPKQQGFTAIAPALAGCSGQGYTKEEALRDLQQAIQEYLQVIDEEFYVGEGVEVLDLAL
ncbi:MAG: type II toxin-antitoxin system HicB family antitoxin [Gammaproteobacteria bacterium]|nr:type II toxin-antitoxin system HicB family antitoxin [Gammaproteobacteria bacterium]